MKREFPLGIIFALSLVFVLFIIFIMFPDLVGDNWQPRPIRIMPLGDSITKGEYKSTDECGYRRPLYFKLKNIGHQVDFVGSCRSGLKDDFDTDYEGHPGFTAKQVAENVHDWLMKNPADFILLHIGTNGLKTNPQDVEEILNNIDYYEKQHYCQITVLLAKIINGKNYNPKVTEFNNNVQAMVEERIKKGDKIIMVDMESALCPQDFYEDNHQSLHPNDLGYEKMAEVWYLALKKLLY